MGRAQKVGPAALPCSDQGAGGGRSQGEPEPVSANAGGVVMSSAVGALPLSADQTRVRAYEAGQPLVPTLLRSSLRGDRSGMECPYAHPRSSWR
jgi:hypothetical protein